MPLSPWRQEGEAASAASAALGGGAKLLNNMGYLHEKLEQSEGAVRRYEQGLLLAEAQYGPSRPKEPFALKRAL